MQRFFSYPAHKNPGQTDGRAEFDETCFLGLPISPEMIGYACYHSSPHNSIKIRVSANDL